MMSLFLLDMLLLAGLSAQIGAGGNPAMDWHSIHGGVEILLVAPCYRSKPDITTFLMGRLTRMQTLLCKIVVNLKIPYLQWGQSSCLNNKYINKKGNCLSLTHQH